MASQCAGSLGRWWTYLPCTAKADTPVFSIVCASSIVSWTLSSSLILHVTPTSLGRFLRNVVRISLIVSGFLSNAAPAPLAMENFRGHPC